MFGLSVLDFVVIALYFLVIIGIGFWAMRRIRNQEDYFLAGRRFGKVIQMFAAFGQATSSDDAVMVTSTTATNGASGIWSALQMLFATPVYWIIMPWYRRLRLLSLGDFFEERYRSRSMAGVYTFVQILGFMIILSMGFNAMSKTIVSFTPRAVAQLNPRELAEYDRAAEKDRLEVADYTSLSAQEKTRLDELRLENPRKIFSFIDRKILVLIVCVIILVYTIAGGLEAAFLTDTIQGCFIILMSLLLFPFAFSKIGDLFGRPGVLGVMETVHAKLPDSFFEIFGSPANIEFTWYYIVALSVLSTLNVAISANMLTASGSAKTEYAARLGFTTGLYLKRVLTVCWGVLGLVALVLYGNSVHDPDMLWGHMVRDLLAPLHLGLVGLMIACMIAALMSTADCLMITASSLLTHNVYRVIAPDQSEKHYVNVGRICGAVVVVGGALMAFSIETMFEQLKYIWELGAVFAAPFWLGMLWRRAGAKAAWGAITVTILLFIVLPVLIPFLAPSIRTNSDFLTMTASQIIDRQYLASEVDVTNRQAEIDKWQTLQASGPEPDVHPEPLVVGQKFVQRYKLPGKSVFWRKGIKIDPQGTRQGYGMLNLDLVLYRLLGWDLSRYSYGMVETIRVINRIVLPFVIMILICYGAKMPDQHRLDRFYVKMKTAVLPDQQADEKELQKSYDDPHRFDHRKMFPRTRWEFCRWDRVAVIGFTIAFLIALAIVGLLYALVNLGASN